MSGFQGFPNSVKEVGGETPTPCGRGMGNLLGVDFFIRWWVSEEECI